MIDHIKVTILNSLLYIARGRIYKLLNAQNGHFRFNSHTHTHTDTKQINECKDLFLYILNINKINTHNT